MQEKTQRSLVTIGIGLVFLLAGWCAAQGQTTLTVKDSEAEKALVKAAKDFSDLQKSFDQIRQQAQSSFDTNQKQISEQIKKKQDDLKAELQKDKKYKPQVDEIDLLEKQFKDLAAHASDEFNKKAGPIQNQIASDNVLIGGLVPIVRKENSLPDTAVFDPGTQTWKDTAKK